MTPPLAQALAQSQRGRRATRWFTAGLKAPAMKDTPDLAAATADAIALFRELGIGYALVGGLAAMVHGRSRYTEDADFVADADPAQVLAAHPDVMKKHGFDPSCTWPPELLYHRSGISVDLWKDAHSPGIVGRAVRRKLGSKFAKVAEAHDLIAMKLRADRPQDDYDISEIIKAQTLDEARLATLVTAAQLRRFRAIVKRVKTA